MDIIINQYYEQQEETVKTLNNRHSYFKNKRVNITINKNNSREYNTTLNNVIFNGYFHQDGNLYISINYIKNNGEPYEKESKVKLEYNNNITIIQNKN
jgi:hypothetical protein